MTHCAFANSVLNVDSGKMGVVQRKKNKRSQQLYLDILKQKETVDDIVGNVLRMRS